MAYCTNCGQPLLGQAKFCAGCGTKVLAEQIRTYASGYKEKMYKGVEQQLKSSLRSYANAAIKKNISRLAEKGISAAKEAAHNTLTEKETAPSKRYPSPKEIDPPPVAPKPTATAKQPIAHVVAGGVTLWTWLYLIVNVIIAVRGYHSDQVIGIVFCSLIVLSLVFIRRKKAKPYNWLTKLLLVVQMAIVALIFYRHVMDQFITFISLLFAALLYIDFTLLFKGNKK